MTAPVLTEDLDLAQYLRPGDTVIVGQGVAEPPTLVEKLLACRVDDVTAFCGYTLSDAWPTARPGRPHLRSFSAAGTMRAVDPARLEVLPVHISAVARHIAAGRMPAEAVLLQVGPPDEQGWHDLGGTVDYSLVAAQRARVVLVEINENMPRTRSAHRLHRSQITASIMSDRTLARSEARPADEIERAVAAHVATVVPDGATIQLGIGSLADAVAAGLHERRGLRVRTGLVGDWLVGLNDAGALAPGEHSVVTGMAVGSEKLYAFLDGAANVEFAPTGEQVDLPTLSRVGPLVAVNGALEVDLLGQANGEIAGSRYLGAVGGQVDFFRAAQYSGGLAVLALPATSRTGTSRIVPELGAGVVTSTKSDVDMVVTEWGVADLRTCSLRERIGRLVAVAHPDHRESLTRYRPDF